MPLRFSAEVIWIYGVAWREKASRGSLGRLRRRCRRPATVASSATAPDACATGQRPGRPPAARVDHAGPRTRGRAGPRTWSAQNRSPQGSRSCSFARCSLAPHIRAAEVVSALDRMLVWLKRHASSVRQRRASRGRRVCRLPKPGRAPPTPAHDESLSRVGLRGAAVGHSAPGVGDVEQDVDRLARADENRVFPDEVRLATSPGNTRASRGLRWAPGCRLAPDCQAGDGTTVGRTSKRRARVVVAWGGFPA